jgi:hypothetical protein
VPGSASSAKPAAAITGPITNGPRAPCRSTSEPAQRDSTNSTRMKGSNAAPAPVADIPWTCTRFSGRKNRPPPNPAYSSNVSRLAPLKVRLRSRRNGSMGAGWRRSTAMKAAMATAASSSAAMTSGALQPRVGASVNAYAAPPNASVAHSAPPRSSRVCTEGALSGTCRYVMAITAAASGRLTRKAHSQEPWSTSQPPTTGPTAEVMPLKPVHRPKARPRSACAKWALISAMLPGTSSAAPAPCTARAAINCPMLDDSAQRPTRGRTARRRQ